MSANPQTLFYIQTAVQNLRARGAFLNGREFRPTQRDALEAYDLFLSSDLPPEQKLKGFFELPTGTGKTALFLAIINEAHIAARQAGADLRTMIVVPTLTLLDQVQNDIRDWAADYQENVGIYSGLKKDLSRELTLITYDSWSALMERGEIDSSHIDILISDEAHRGTSDKRLTAKFNAFSGGTVQLAFTATARFDDSKSVEQSHTNQIFSRGVAESVRLGELASYIQTQLHVIRVAPPALSDVFEQESASDSPKPAALRQKAWMNHMVHVFREGRDEHTGDLLTDNKAGFFVAGVEMSNHLEDFLNDDPVLKSRAQANGCLGVAVAIHSRLRPTEQKRRLEDFKAGKYLAAISDEQMKEGYDDPALKTVFDYPRGSLVDKAQIVGRGARQWYNPLKDRAEGCTFIDTIVYIGHDDPDEDKRRRNDALENSILAWSILDGTVVLAPGAVPRPPRDIPAPSSSDGTGTTYGDYSVESHITLDDLNIIRAEKETLLETNKIPLTDEMRDQLKELMRVKGMGSRAFQKAHPEIAKLTSESVIDSWITPNSTTKNVDKVLWDKVITAYEALPDAQVKEWIPLTDDMRDQLKKLMTQKGMGSRAFQKAHPEIAKLTSTGIIESWINPNSSVKNVDKPLWDRVITAYESLPDAQVKELIHLTDDMRDQLKGLMRVKGMGAVNFLKAHPEIAELTNAPIIESWLKPNSGVKNVEKGIWETVITVFEKLLDAEVKEWIPLTDDIRDQLTTLMTQKGMRSKTFLKEHPEIAKLISTNIINSWINPNSSVKNVEKGIWKTVITAFEKLPDADVKEWIPLTDEMRDQLTTLMTQKGMGVQVFLKAHLEISMLTSTSIINNWITPNSSIKNVDKALWDKVIAAYEKLPDAKIKELISLTDDMRDQLTTLMTQKEMRSKAFLKEHPEIAKLISTNIINSWVKPYSGIKNVDKSVWDKVIAAYQALPDKVPNVKVKPAEAPATPKP